MPPPLDRVLAARGLADAPAAAALLEPAAGHDPYLLGGMAAAVARLERAWRLGERVAVYGDYDVDGVTATALLSKLFALLGAPHETYLPDRAREGYGLNAAALEGLRARGCGLVVTVDCGISNATEAVRARELGLDLVVTDHHLPPGRLPEAAAVVNPRLSPDYPCEALAGVGVAYKLADALLRALDHPRRGEFLDAMLELVALGTVCDLVPLEGENRVLVRDGLARMRSGRWLGLRALASAAGLDPADADAGALAFQYGPRINAGGRIGDAALGLRLLLGKDPAAARELAGRLDALNSERRGLERSATEEASRRAEALLRDDPGARSLALWDPAWHPGVVGPVASRLLERFGLPVFVFAVVGDAAKGSGRARAPFALVRALEACSGHLLRWGGHEAAAGATARAADLPAFARAFGERAREALPERPGRIFEIDAEVGLDEVGESWMGPLGRLEPHGRGNPRPLFLVRGVRPAPGARTMGKEGEHLRLALTRRGRTLEGVGFGLGARLEGLGEGRALDAIFHLDWNRWNGRRTLQAQWKDLRPAVEAA